MPDRYLARAESDPDTPPNPLISAGLTIAVPVVVVIVGWALLNTIALDNREKLRPQCAPWVVRRSGPFMRCSIGTSLVRRRRRRPGRRHGHAVAVGDQAE